MAGRGSRLRPHTLTVPKPLVPIAGKPVVQRIVEDLSTSFSGDIEEIAFIIGDFGDAVEQELLSIAEKMGAKGRIYYQDKPLGTAHAILCAADSLSGPCIVAFADTLFQADFTFDPMAQDGIIWVQKVEDPSAFGVVKLDAEGCITEFVEKSPVFVSDLAIVGIYFFKDGDNLKAELQYLLDNEIKDKGEYQITSALENMKAKGLRFHAGEIMEWLDCGNKDNVVHTNQRILDIKRETEQLVAEDVVMENAVLRAPCYVGPGVVLRNAVVGPYVSIGSNSVVENSVIENGLIQNNSQVSKAVLNGFMIGNHVNYEGLQPNISIGDYTNYES
ncbi:MAG: NTP transferase domain-containing protein [Phaeodactylibacter sp.]|nr:NTP transferase domain-containing protein [Phaeodactylibacter sp.]